MQQPRLHPLAAISAVSLLGAVTLPFLHLGVKLGAGERAAFTLLASPFVILLLGHLYLCRSWRRNAVLAVANAPLWAAWLFAVVSMWYLQAGWYGVAVFAPVMAALASACLLGARFLKEPQSAQS